MANHSCFSLFLLVSLLLAGHGVLHLEASHHVYQHLLESTSDHETQSSSASSSQPYRTGYHFQPPKNWMNDPNGPMIYKGIYHLFYQYNPKGAVWGNIVWAHSTSTDLINWTPHNHAIYPSQPSDHYGCWSGSATMLPGGKPVILYTGIIDPKPINTQVQNLVVPKNLSDPYLREWIKYPNNPLMSPTVENQINGSSFRDPTTAWLGHDNIWRVIIGSKIHRKGLAILYRSRDFKKWTKAKHPLHSAKNTGMWECPDFFPVSTTGQNGIDTSMVGPNVKHVVKASLDDTKHEYYTIGTYNITLDRYFADKGSVESDLGLRYDYGKFYASKTFFDHEKNRRILWGWINESSSVADDVKKGWSGIQAIPRKIWLDKSGKQLLQWPVVEIEKLRGKQIQLPSKILKGGSVIEVSGVTAVQADIEISFEISDFKKAEILDPSWTNPQLLCSQKSASVKSALGPFGLLTLASKDLQEYTAVFFRIFKGQQGKYVVLMCSDQSRSSLNDDNDKTTYGAFLNVNPLHEKLSLRSLVMESFGGDGKACITARVYPTLATGKDAHLYAFNYGTEKVKLSSLSAWSMKKAHIY
ncbi:hypothetical protein JRO89_XS09G0217300 [Xanthoceras sorbifolium]|uniref:Beta-fructofuranosidase n=1 Tax=Xanthoceras sorbifolium TaxID=99658 RepID=A0ABQ8HME0_9ROSI|nr:hypothetical protein JRO89_XS09G0217300 [Xanthoceras sorbifolium]